MGVWSRYGALVVVPRRLLPLPLLALALAPVHAHAAAGKKRSVKGFAVPCLAADGETWSYAAKPASCAVLSNDTSVPTVIPVRKLAWKRWTATSARAEGTVKGPAYEGRSP